MPSIISTNTLQVVMQYNNTTENAENVYHVHKSTPWASADLDAIADAFLAWETDVASSLRAGSTSLTRVTVTDLTSLTSNRVDRQLTTAINGTAGGDPLPSNVTFAVKASINSRGRGRSGRVFWIGFAESQVDGDTLPSATADEIRDALIELRATVNAAVAGAFLSVMHLYVGGVFQTNAPTSPITTFAYTDRTVDSQKDRLPGHKRHKRRILP